jgi:hypothetical protein
MRNRQRARNGRSAAARSAPRRRALPKWLDLQGLDAVARARCLMVLSVLSGEKTVSDAIAEHKISRGTYYQMETRALTAVLSALNPLTPWTEKSSAELSAAATRIEGLLARVEQLEQEKRRTQRLLLLTRKSIRAPVTTGRRGRPPKVAFLGSMPSGRTRSGISRTKAIPAASSTPTRAGESTP